MIRQSLILSQATVDGRLHIQPKAPNLGISKGQELSTNHPCDPFLPIAPPPEVRKSCPVRRPFRPSSGPSRQHKGEAPPLRCRRWVQMSYFIGEVRLRRRDALCGKIGEVGDLIAEHLVDCGCLEDSLAGDG